MLNFLSHYLAKLNDIQVIREKKHKPIVSTYMYSLLIQIVPQFFSFVLFFNLKKQLNFKYTPVIFVVNSSFDMYGSLNHQQNHTGRKLYRSRSRSYSRCIINVFFFKNNFFAFELLVNAAQNEIHATKLCFKNTQHLDLLQGLPKEPTTRTKISYPSKQR